jgi:hypothetical protein
MSVQSINCTQQDEERVAGQQTETREAQLVITIALKALLSVKSVVCSGSLCLTPLS